MTYVTRGAGNVASLELKDVLEGEESRNQTRWLRTSSEEGSHQQELIECFLSQHPWAHPVSQRGLQLSSRSSWGRGRELVRVRISNDGERKRWKLKDGDIRAHHLQILQFRPGPAAAPDLLFHDVFWVFWVVSDWGRSSSKFN